MPIRVHVDHAKDAAAAAEWEAARRQYLAWLSAAGEREAPTLVVEDEASHTYRLLRPFDALGQLDALRARQSAADDRAKKLAGAEAWERNEARFHTSLAPPHYSELWSVPDRDALDRLARGERWFVDAADVMPPEEQAYEASLVEIDRAVVAKGEQPRVDIDVVYGSGRWLSVWPERADARAPGDVAASHDVDQETWRVRRDLSSWP